MITVVNVDPHQTQVRPAIVGAQLDLPLGLTVDYVLFAERFRWRGGPNNIRVEA